MITTAENTTTIKCDKCQKESIASNVWHIAEGGDYEAQVFKIVQMFNRSTTVHFGNTPPLLTICCYVPFFFTNFN